MGWELLQSTCGQRRRWLAGPAVWKLLLDLVRQVWRGEKQHPELAQGEVLQLLKPKSNTRSLKVLRGIAISSKCAIVCKLLGQPMAGGCGAGALQILLGIAGWIGNSQAHCYKRKSLGLDRQDLRMGSSASSGAKHASHDHRYIKS